MHCPSCGSNELKIKNPEKDLSVLECQKCFGYWLSAPNYWQWKEKQEAVLPEVEGESTIDAEDSTSVKVCPECMKIMPKYRIGHGSVNKIERCNTCAGIWFDKNEWELLVSKNLHDEIHKIFSQPWQDKVIKEEAEKRYESLVKQKIGEELFTNVKEFKALITEHREKSIILAYLNS